MSLSVLSALLLWVVAVGAELKNLCPPESESNYSVETVLAHEDCTKFYKCIRGEPVEMSCPEGLYFNVVFRYCDWLPNVDCNGRRLNGEFEVISTTEAVIEALNDSVVNEAAEIEFLENGCPVDPLIHWLVPDDNDCALFYYCVWGAKVQRGCPHELHFNRALQVCDWAEFANCTLSTSSIAATEALGK